MMTFDTCQREEGIKREIASVLIMRARRKGGVLRPEDFEPGSRSNPG
jgi:hypothetical protein